MMLACRVPTATSGSTPPAGAAGLQLVDRNDVYALEMRVRLKPLEAPSRQAGAADDHLLS